MSQSKLAVIILQYNKSFLTGSLLRSIYQFEQAGNFHIVVADNHSTEDDSFEQFKKEFPAVVFKKNNENLGFARGINKEVVALPAGIDYILLINNDIVLHDNSITQCLEQMKMLHADAVTCRMLHDDGNELNNFSSGLSVGSFIFFNLTGLSALWRKWIRRRKKPSRVYSINGAFLMLRKKVFTDIGMFTEDYFMYSEDKDLMFKLNNAGARMFYHPATSLVHSDGQSAAMIWEDQHKIDLIVRQDIEVYSKYNRPLAVKIFARAWYLQQYLKHTFLGDEIAALYKNSLSPRRMKETKL